MGDQKPKPDISFAGTFASSAFAACFAEIIWTPYAEVMDTLPDICKAGESIWRTRSPLIYFSCVEYHFVERVFRQFGRRQAIPQEVVRYDRFHWRTRQGNANTNWEVKNNEFVKKWNDRLLYVVDEQYGVSVADGYMDWYKRITRLRIGSTRSTAPARGIMPVAGLHDRTICTIPLDTAKVRLQLQKKAVAGDVLSLPKYKGMLGTVATIAREEGMSALWKGIVPGLHRQCLFGGLRIGLYEPVKNFYVGDNFVGDVPLSKKILAALTTGAVAIAVANPTDLVKVRLQAEGKLPAGVPRRYSGALDAYSTIARQEGVKALWTGLGPNVARNAIINAAELASYDQVKQSLLKIPGFSDNVFTHLLSGLGAGFFAVCIGSPVDVVKSRMMGDSTYKSTVDCFVRTLKNDGPLAFYKGFIPNFGRLGSWNVIMFLTLEQAKKFMRSLESA